MKRPKSKKARKQRKFLFTAPLHVRRKIMSVHLSKELREKYGTRNLPARKGDEVQVMRGEFKGKTGKISRTDLKKYKFYIDGIKRKTTTGIERLVPIYPSNLKIINLSLDDKRRSEILKKREKSEK